MLSVLTVTGALLEDQTDAPLAGLLVEAYDVDAATDQRLTGTLTDANGAFTLRFQVEDGSARPAVQVTAYRDGRSEVIHQTDPFQLESSPHDLGRLRVRLSPLKRAVPAYTSALGHDLPDASAPEASSLPLDRRFDFLPAHRPPDELLERLGTPDGPMSERRSLWAEDSYDSPHLPAGYTFLVQFLTHDLTHELVRQAGADPPHVDARSFLRLRSLYGPGPEMAPELYAFDDQERFTGRLLAGASDASQDLPRNRQGRALVADPRNDENVVLAQLHLAFVRFHNAMVHHLEQTTSLTTDLFSRAQQLVRWHYQWIVVHDVLPRLVGPQAVQQALDRTAPTPGGAQGLPLEVALGVFRFIYSQVRLSYQLNDDATVALLPDTEDGDPLVRSRTGSISPRLAVDWTRFFEYGDAPSQPSKLIDTKITPAFLDLPLVEDPRPARRSVAARFFLQGKRAGLPSGEAVARALGKSVSLPTASALRTMGLQETPFLYYVLAEAEHQYQDTGKDQLGPVAGRLLADALIRRLRHDPQSYLNAHPTFEPIDAFRFDDGTFDAAALVTAGT